MAKIRGNVVNMCSGALGMYPNILEKVNEQLIEKNGLKLADIGHEDWIQTSILNDIFIFASEHSLVGKKIIVNLGRRIYPMINEMGQIPKHVNTVLKLIEFDGVGFGHYHKGSDVVQRKFIKLSEGHVIVDAPSPGYDCRFIEGVFEGILGMYQITDYKIEQSSCILSGDNSCIYDIQWKKLNE